MLDFSKLYELELEYDDSKIKYCCEIINYNETSKLYTVSVPGLGTVKIVEEDDLTEI